MKIHEIEAKIADLIAESDAIDTVMAKAERTEPNELETARKLEIHGKDGKSGLIGCPADEQKKIEASGLYAQLEFARNVDAVKKAQASTKGVELITATAADYSTDPMAKVRVPAKCRRHGALKAFRGPDAEKEAYISGLFFAASIYNHEESRQQLKDMDVIDFKAAMSTTDTAGGEVVPDITEATIVTVAEENGVLRRFARPTAMTSEVHIVPERTAGLTVYYPGQNTAITASDLTTAKVTLTAFEWATITEVSARLNLTALVSMADELAMNIGLAFALAEDTNGFIGDGTGTYGSISGLDDAINANSVYTAAAGNISFATLDMADFEGVTAKLPRFKGANPAWFIHSAGYFSAMVRLMNASGGTPGSEVASGYNASFLGYPVVFTQVLPSAPGVSENVCFFGDLSQSVYMGTLAGVQVAADGGGKYFEKAQIAVRGLQFADITVSNRDASSAGPMVALATPGA